MQNKRKRKALFILSLQINHRQFVTDDVRQELVQDCCFPAGRLLPPPSVFAAQPLIWSKLQQQQQHSRPSPGPNLFPPSRRATSSADCRLQPYVDPRCRKPCRELCEPRPQVTLYRCICIGRSDSVELINGRKMYRIYRNVPTISAKLESGKIPVG